MARDNINDMTNFRYIWGLSLVTVLFWLFFPHQPEGGEVGTASPAHQVVSRQEILEAMRQVGDYDPTATTNGARFQWEVVLYLARRAEQRDPKGPPLFINSVDWYRAFKEVTGRTDNEMPVYARLTRQYEQHMDVEYRMDRVIRKVIEGPAPQFALNVRIWWEERPGKPDRYSYLDTLATPNLKVTNHRVMSYRLLDLGDWLVCDKIAGLTGRPTSGLLGFIFRIIGDGHLIHSRMAISNDGLQVVRGTSKKGFMSKTTTATIYSDGEMIKDLPEGRPDLMELKQRIKQPLEVDYVKLPEDRIRVPKSPALEETDGRADKRREIHDGTQQGGRGTVDSSVAAVRRHHPPVSE